MTDLRNGSTLERCEGLPIRHLLDGEVVGDGTVLEFLTDTGWVSGHYRAQLHPESAAVAFDLHVPGAGGSESHVRIFLPDETLLRRPCA